jgi:hypothetical protein
VPITPPSASIESNLLGPSAQITRRIEIYEADGITLWAGIDNDTPRLVTGGAVSVDGTRDERRSLDLTLDNLDSALRPTPGGFWYDKILKVYRGITIPTESYEVQVGEFMIDRITAANFPRTIKITARDYAKKLMLNKFTQDIIYTAGSTLEQLVQDIAASGGITKFVMPVTGVTIGKDFPFTHGTSRWDAVKQIADSYGYEVFFDNQGYFTMRAYQDPVSSPTVYTFETGQFGNLVSYDRSTDDSRMYNHVAVYGGSTDGTVAPVFAEAINTEPTSPTNVAKIGDRLYEYASEFITTVAQAQDVANKFLSVHALESYELSFQSIVFPWLEANTIIEFIDPDAAPEDPTRFLMDTFTIPLDLSPMSATAKRVTIVSSTGSF